ncbi:MAG TPA: tetratricopeptide repeat protein [Bryobacteraceae bacterium]|jgi:tetratricopeptide (TPR) repeat protein
MEAAGLKRTARGAMLLVALELAAGLAQAQTEAAGSFEDVAQRAQAALQVRPAEAVKLYRQAVEMRPDWAEGWFNLAASLYDLGRYAESRDAFRKEVKLMPRMAPGWAFLGLAESEVNDPVQALADIRKGEELGLRGNHEFELAVRLKAAGLLLRASVFDEAMEQLRPVADGTENSPAVVETMGLCSLAVFRTMEGLSDEQRAVVRLTGKAAWALVSHRPEEAGAAYAELLERYPNQPGVHYAHALYLIETDLPAALAELETEVQHTPNHWPALILMSTLRIRQGSPELALESLRAVLKLVPPRYLWLCHAEMGRAYLTSDNTAAAIGELETAMRLEPGSPQVRYLVAQAYRRAGRKEDAQKQTLEFERLKAQQDPAAVPEYQRFLMGGSGH